MYTDRQIDRRIDTQIDRQIDKQNDRQIDRLCRTQFGSDFRVPSRIPALGLAKTLQPGIRIGWSYLVVLVVFLRVVGKCCCV